MKIHLVSDTGGLRAIESDWRALCERSTNHHYFQTFGWLWAWWTTSGENDGYRLHVVTIEEEGRLVLICPLVIQPGGPWRKLQWMGQDGDYGDAIVEDGGRAEIWLEAAWQALTRRKGYDVVVLDQVRPDASIRSGLAKRVRVSESTSISPIISCDSWPDWDSYYATRKSKFRSKQRRQRRRLGKEGTLVFEIVDEAEAIDNVVQWVAANKGKWVEQTDRVMRASEDLFVEAAVHEAHRAGTLYMAVLRLDGSIIAADLGIRYRDCLYSWLSAFDADWQNYSPGRVVLEDSIKWSFANGVKTFDLLSGADRFKFDWTEQALTLDTLVYPRTVWGWVYCEAMYGRSREPFRRMYQSLPGSLRNWIIRRFLSR